MVVTEHRVLDAMGRAMGRFSILRPGDRVAVGVSGGKDSLTLLHALVAYKKRAPFPYELIADNVPHGCDVCSRHRRYHLYNIASELGCGVLALGHTADDCAESLLRNVLFNGRIASLPPVSQSQKGSVRLIRPLVYVNETLSTEYAADQGFLPIACVCSEKESVRREIREFLDGMKSRHVGISDSIAAALGNVNLYTLLGHGLKPATTFETEDEECLYPPM